MGEEVLCETATTQNAATHCEYIKLTLRDYYRKEKDCIVAVIADNASVMRKLAELLGAPMIGCCSHKLNLAVEKVVKDEPDIEDMLESMNEVMKVASSCNTRAMLARTIDLHPVLLQRTRWSGKYRLLKRYNELIEALMNVALRDRKLKQALDNVTADEDLILLWGKRFYNFEHITQKLQKKKLPFHEGRKALDIGVALNELNLFEDLQEPFGETHLGRACRLVTSGNFESGLNKLQRYQAGKEPSGRLTELEKEALRKLLEPGQEAPAAEGGQSEDDPRCEAAALYDSPVRGATPRADDEFDRYMPAMFILGSTATVERLWSKARNLMPDNRASMAPILVEALLFLSENKELWGQIRVNKAIEQNKARNAESRAAKKGTDVDEWEATTINED